MRAIPAIFAAAVCTLAVAALAQQSAAPTAPSAGPYKLLKKVPVGGAGGSDYVFADSANRRLYIPRSSRVDVYDLDSLQSVGTISGANNVHGAAVDIQSKHGFCSSNPVVMWDTDTLKTLKTIDVPAGSRPDGILFDPFTQRVMILSHQEPNVTFIDAKDGSVLGTTNLGGEPEQGASDNAGKLYISLEDQSKVAVVDTKTMKLLNTYALAPAGGAPAGLAMDPKNHILFVSGREPPATVVMNADDGKIITSFPIGSPVDASEFNPDTMEAFISTGDGNLTIIKETDPKTFAVEQTVPTLQGARTSTLDAKTGNILLIANDPTARPPTPASTAPATSPAAAAATQPAAPAFGGGGGRRGGGRGRGAAGVFSVIVVGKD